MFAEENKALAGRFSEEIVNAKDFSVADEIFAANHTYSDPSSPGIPTGPEGQKALIGAYTAAFPDLHHAVGESPWYPADREGGQDMGCLDTSHRGWQDRGE